MNRVRAVCFMWGLIASWGNCAAELVPPPESSEPLRQRIVEQRVLNEAVFLDAQQACAARFAVSDCLTKVRRERRAVMDDLRRQEVLLNDLDRQAKAAAAIARVQSNQSTERQQAGELPSPQMLQDAQDRQQRSEAKKTTTVVVRPAQNRASTTPPTKQPNIPDESLNQQRYADKLLEAQQRKADKTRSLKDKNSARPLPLPADM